MDILKFIGVMLFYALLIWLGVYISINVVKLTQIVGSMVGVVGGVILCVVLWLYAGKKFVKY